jgi:hypothetical protein
MVCCLLIGAGCSGPEKSQPSSYSVIDVDAMSRRSEMLRFRRDTGQDHALYLADYARRCLLPLAGPGAEVLSNSGGDRGNILTGFAIIRDQNGNRQLEDSEILFDGVISVGLNSMQAVERGRSANPATRPARYILRRVYNQLKSGQLQKFVTCNGRV